MLDAIIRNALRFRLLTIVLALVALGSLAVITTSTELIGGRACRCAPTLTGS